jgi:hypothetical protein
MQHSRSILDTLIQSAAVDLFHSCGLAVAPLDRSRPRKVDLQHHELTGGVTFTGQGFSGVVSVVVPTEAFALIRQDTARPYSGRDWVREIANQLVGRIKSRLLQFNVTLSIGLPTIMNKDAVDRQRSRGPFLSIYGFRTLRGEIIITLSGEIDLDIFVYSGADNVPSEGDIILF